MSNKPIFIAEIKTVSPFGYKSKHTFISLAEHAIHYGDWISVHTSILWGGDFSVIDFVRRKTHKPILAKGIHATNDDIVKAFDHGADYVLVVDRNPFAPNNTPDKRIINLRDKILLEMQFHEVKRLTDTNAEWKNFKYVNNTRDLKSGLPFKQYTLNEMIELGVWTCQASYIKTPDDVVPGVNAFIVGEHLIDFCKRLPRD